MKIFGYTVKLHWSLLILLLLSFTGDQSVIYHMCMIFALLVSVLLHEFGHVFTAKLYGFKTNEIKLTVLGGTSDIEEFHTNPKSEFWIIAFGPIVNILIYCFIIAAVTTFFIFTGFDYDNVKRSSSFLNFILTLGNLNLILALFNLLPIFPMDGGKMLRAIIHMFMKSFEMSTKLSACIGVMFGLFLLIACFKYTLITTFFIALFMVFYNLQIVFRKSTDSDHPSA